MKTGKEILTEYDNHPTGEIEGFITLEEMIDQAMSEACKEQDKITRHACLKGIRDIDLLLLADKSHAIYEAKMACMNTKAI